MWRPNTFDILNRAAEAVLEDALGARLTCQPMVECEFQPLLAEGLFVDALNFSIEDGGTRAVPEWEPDEEHLEAEAVRRGTGLHKLEGELVNGRDVGSRRGLSRGGRRYPTL